VTRLLHLRVKPIAMDHDGILPMPSTGVPRDRSARALHLSTLQNPTAVTLSLERARRFRDRSAHDVRVIEDERLRFSHAGRAANLGRTCSRTAHVNGTSKCLAPGLRIAFLVAPPDLVGRVANGVRTTVWMATPLWPR